MTNNDLLTVYRHAKALVQSLEKELQNQGLIKCQACHEKHSYGQPHLANPFRQRVVVVEAGKVRLLDKGG